MNTIFENDKPVSFQNYYLSFCNSLVMFLYTHMDCERWIQFYSAIEDFLALPNYASFDQSTYPYILSFYTHKKAIYRHDTCTIYDSQQTQTTAINDSASFPKTTFSSLKSFIQTLMSIVIHPNSQLITIESLLSYIIESNKESQVLLSIVTVFLYEGASSSTFVQVGQLLKEAFTHTSCTIIHECILRALNQLRPFIVLYHLDYSIAI